MRRPVATSLFFIKRGPRPAHHRAPFHPYIVCTRKGVAKWEAGWTGDQAWVWERGSAKDGGEGWLLVRWNGFDIDYGHVVRGFDLPDGEHGAVYHRHRDRGYSSDEPRRWLGYDEALQGPWSLLAQTVWWSNAPIPEWLVEAGVKLPEDHFSLRSILEHIKYADEDQRRDWAPMPEWPDWWPRREATLR